MAVSTSLSLSRCSSRRSSSVRSCTLSPAPRKHFVIHLTSVRRIPELLPSLCVADSFYATRQTKRTIPIEIMELVAHNAYYPTCSFEPLRGFASASHALHAIAMRIVCTHLNVISAERWSNGIPSSKNMALWVRTLQGAGPAISSSEAIVLQKFDCLRTVQVSFATESIANIERTIFPVLNHLPAALTELSLTDLPDANRFVLVAISAKFTGLRRLELSCAERLDPACCWDCFEESASRVWHSPIPDMSSTAEELTVSLKAALAPLVHLEHLFLGFFLSPEELFYEHIEHAQLIDRLNAASAAANDDDDDDFPVTLPFGPEWCLDCFERYAPAVRLVELQAALALAQSLKELKTVGWASFFGRQKQEMEGRRTMIWIARNEGHVKVRRRPF